MQARAGQGQQDHKNCEPSLQPRSPQTAVPSSREDHGKVTCQWEANPPEVNWHNHQLGKWTMKTQEDKAQAMDERLL